MKTALWKNHFIVLQTKGVQFHQQLRRSQKNELFKEYEVKPVKFGRLKIGGRELFESYLGKFKIKGVKVEIMGNLKEKLGRKWIYLHKRLKSPKIVKIEGMKIPVSPLEEQLKSYSRLGRKKDAFRVKQIKKALRIYH